ncbi:chemerin-like receptor 1 [Paroedura picta]|uniref:chemerin-like receptor 1 n=1 Tax=Paroedura picta TaxID=143630 RepID=UPI00101507F7
MENTTLLSPLEVVHSNSSNDSTVYYDYEYDEDYIFTLHERLKVLSMVIYSIAFVVGVLGNGLVIFITGFRMKKTVNTIWFLNLAIADFTFTFFLPLSIAYLAMDFHWPFGEAMCKLNSTIAFINLYASVYLLTVISIDRCISVLAPVWAQNHRSPRCASFVALGVWILALVLSAPSIHFRKTLQKEDVINCYNHFSSDRNHSRVIHQAMTTSRFIFAFVIPFYVIILCYGAIVLRLKRDRLARSSKPFKVITAVIVAFFICWFPYHVFSFLEIRAYKDPNLHLVIMIGHPLTSSLAFINSCLNPILYVFMGHDFKERLKRSILAVLESAFTEDSQATTQTKTKSSDSQDSQGL